MDPFRKSRTLSLNSAFHYKRTVGFIESAMPADGIPRCHSPRTETSARPVSKSSSKKDYTIPRPSKRPHVGRSAAQQRGRTVLVNATGELQRHILRALRLPLWVIRDRVEPAASPAM